VLNRSGRFNLWVSLVSVCKRPMRLRGVPVRIFSVTYFVLSNAPLAIMGDEKGLEFPHQGEKPYRLPRTRSGAA
jgi:hypothetical protein